MEFETALMAVMRLDVVSYQSVWRVGGHTVVIYSNAKVVVMLLQA